MMAQMDQMMNQMVSGSFPEHGNGGSYTMVSESVTVGPDGKMKRHMRHESSARGADGKPIEEKVEQWEDQTRDLKEMKVARRLGEQGVEDVRKQRGGDEEHVTNFVNVDESARGQFETTWQTTARQHGMPVYGERPPMLSYQQQQPRSIAPQQPSYRQPIGYQYQQQQQQMPMHPRYGSQRYY